MQAYSRLEGCILKGKWYPVLKETFYLTGAIANIFKKETRSCKTKCSFE